MLGGAPSLLRAAPRRWRARWQESCSPRRVSGGAAWSCRARAQQFKEVRDVRDAYANGCRNDAYAKPAKGNHRLAVRKTLGSSPGPRVSLQPLEARLPVGVMAWQESERRRGRRTISVCAAALKSRASIIRAPRDLTRVAALQIDRREPAEPAAVAAEHRCAQSTNKPHKPRWPPWN